MVGTVVAGVVAVIISICILVSLYRSRSWRSRQVRRLRAALHVLFLADFDDDRRSNDSGEGLDYGVLSGRRGMEAGEIEEIDLSLEMDRPDLWAEVGMFEERVKRLELACQAKRAELRALERQRDRWRHKCAEPEWSQFRCELDGSERIFELA